MVSRKWNDEANGGFEVIASEGLQSKLSGDMPKRNGAGIDLLADPTRRRIIAALAVSARRPSSLAIELGLSRPATTHQLNLLRAAGLVRVGRSQADGRVRLYFVDPRSHGRITAWLAGTEIARPVVMSIDDDGVVRDG